MFSNIEYSLLLCAKRDYIESLIEEIEKLLKSGIKLYLLTNNPIRFNNNDEKKSFEKAGLLQIMIEDVEIEKPILIKDGNNYSNLDQVIKLFPMFNIEQYKIEHAPTNENIIVKAGAGTGKTTVMIDRVLYLILKEQVPPQEIVMITFTRKAAKNMYDKLKEEIFLRFHATQSNRYLYLLEQLNEMQIKTIHSFSKDLLKEMGSLRGFGLNVRLKSFTEEKRRWIEKEINRYFEQELNNFNQNMEAVISPLKLYELIDTIEDFWTKFEQKGFSSDEIINHVDFGEAPLGSELLNNLIEKVIRNCEKRFNDEKEIQNAITISDLTRQIDIIRQEYGIEAFQNLSMKISYLFVDEFQDSDDVQIRLISAIQETFQTTLFVVGDTKQSIYRFRGANHTAFEMLKQSLNERGITINDEDYYLNKNYRTTKELLSEMDFYFSWWGEQGYLQYEPTKDRLIGIKSVTNEKEDKTDEDEEDQSADKKYITILKKREEAKENLRTIIMPFIKERYKNIIELNKKIKDEKKKEKIAVLTRTIEEARLINDWCNAENNLPTKLEVGGGFFLSEAVRNFYSLILALLYPKNGKFIANLLEGPFGQGHPLIMASLLARGRYDSETIKLMKQATSFPFERYQNFLTYQPVLSVLRTIIEERKPYDWYYSRKLDELKGKYSDDYTDEDLEKEAEYLTREYELTIGKLFEKLHETFSDDFVSLNQIANWLQVQIATNRDEEEVAYSGNNKIDYVHILTVHRSKGLEYHTVIIPFTERPFTTSFSKIIFDDAKKKAGWIINKPGYEERYNNHYKALSEKDDLESIKEETRLLYVAMSRAKNELVIIRNLKNDAYYWTWSKLLTEYR